MRIFGLVALAAATWGTAASAQSPVEISRSQTIPIAPAGTVSIDHTWGEVTVDAWDRPAIEVVVTARSKKAYPDGEAQEMRTRLARFGFDMKAVSPEQAIVTGLAPKASLLKPFGGKSGVSVHYAIRMPRTGTLIMHHGIGEVSVTGLKGDLDVSAGTGSVHIAVPIDPNVAVESAVRIGEITLATDLRARGESQRKALVGERFSYRPAGANRHISARVGIGSVSIGRERVEPVATAAPSSPL
jgi:hypothetical protein